jgi:hypothetical protein
MDQSTLVAVKEQADQLKSRGLTRAQVADRLIEAGLEAEDVDLVLGVGPQRTEQVQRIERQAGVKVKQDHTELLVDLADCLEGLVAELRDVKPNHRNAWNQLDALAQRVRNAVS